LTKGPKVIVFLGAKKLSHRYFAHLSIELNRFVVINLRNLDLSY